MEHVRQRLRLMQLSSSSLPVGSFTWSQGLEWAVEAGWVPDAEAFKTGRSCRWSRAFSVSICRCFPDFIRRASKTIWRRQHAGRPTFSPAGKRVNCVMRNATAGRPLRACSKAGSRTVRQSGGRCLCKASSAAWRGSEYAGALAPMSWP